jgi:hypothetical protein
LLGSNFKRVFWLVDLGFNYPTCHGCTQSYTRHTLTRGSDQLVVFPEDYGAKDTSRAILNNI